MGSRSIHIFFARNIDHLVETIVLGLRFDCLCLSLLALIIAIVSMSRDKGLSSLMSTKLKEKLTEVIVVEFVSMIVTLFSSRQKE